MEEDEADEFMAVKPWVGDLNNSIPSSFQLEKYMEAMPEESLQLSYIFGYRCFDARQTAGFSNRIGEIVFASAALGVKMEVQKNKQSFFNEHEEDIISFDMHPSREICATGQMAMKGKSKFIDIFVWNVHSKEVLANLKGFHLRAIQQLKFSPDGKLLFSVGKDDDNSLAIYDWANGRVVATSKVDKKNVLDMAIGPNAKSFLTVGSKHVKYWKMNGSRLKSTRVSWKGVGKAESVFCCESLERNFVIGTSKGKLICVSGGSMRKPIEAHEGKIYVLKFDESNSKLYSGGLDGQVIEWNVNSGKLKKSRVVLQMTKKDSLSPKIRALDIFQKQMLVGTQGSDLFLLHNYSSSQKKQLILQGHYAGELWGLSIHPKEQKYVTCGDDKTVRLWDLKNRKCYRTVQIKEKARAVCFSYSGETIAIATMTGKIILFDAKLNQLCEHQSKFTRKNQWIEELKFSPNDQYLAFGAHGGASKVEVLKFFKKKSKLRFYGKIQAGITSALLHLDWDVDSSTVVVNSQAYELKFVNVESKQQVRASACKDIEWQSWTCKIGFPVQGIYPGVDGTDVNTVCRAGNKKILATGDDFQLVKLFKYPSVVPKSEFKSYKGHASHVTRVRFSTEDQFLVSTGGNDKTSIIWKVILNQEDEEESDFEDEFVHRKMERELELSDEEGEESSEKDGGMFEMEENDADEFMAVKPWLGAIKAPSDFTGVKFNQDEKPALDIELEFCYGYRAKDCRNNLFNLDGHIFYHAAALNIKFDQQSNTQRFFDLHNDDVISMDFSENRRIFASGEIGPKPSIFLFDENMNKVQELKEGVIKGVVDLKFSPSGKLLACVCLDDNHMIVVFDLQNNSMVACEKGDTAKIVALDWLNENSFVSVGIKHGKIWTIRNGVLKGKRASFGKNSNKVVFAKKWENKVLCGSVKGELQVWSSGGIQKSIKLQKGCLDSIWITRSKKVLVGGKSRILHILDSKLKSLVQLNLKRFLFEGQSLKIRAITTNPEETEIYLGLYSSQIFKLSSQNQESLESFTDKSLDVVQLISGHYAKNLKWTNEVWGLSILNSEKQFLTVSDDATLRLYDCQTRKQLKLLNMNIDKTGAKLEPDSKTKDLQEQSKLRSVAICHQDKHIAIGCKEGTLRIVNIKKWKQIKMVKRRKKWIQCLRYSPDNEKLAVGSHDGYIDIYNVLRNYRILFKMKKHSSFITALDFSIDSQYLHSTCGAYELLFWDVESGKQLTRGASALRDEEWASYTVPFGWHVQGIFQREWDGSDVNYLDRNNKNGEERFLAVADDFGKIRVYKFPCLERDQGSLILRGHSSHVTSVQWTKNDKWLISTGGEDQCVMQWRVSI